MGRTSVAVYKENYSFSLNTCFYGVSIVLNNITLAKSRFHLNIIYTIFWPLMRLIIDVFHLIFPFHKGHLFSFWCLNILTLHISSNFPNNHTISTTSRFLTFCNFWNYLLVKWNFINFGIIYHLLKCFKLLYWV